MTAGISSTAEESPFIEPSRSVPLTWSDYRTRMTLTYVLAVVAGVVIPTLGLLVGGESFAFAALNVLSLLAFVAVFVVVPGELRRRVIAGVIVVAVLAVIFAVTQATGLVSIGDIEVAPSLVVPAIVVACWYFVRRRPPVVYLGVVLSLLLFVLLAAVANAILTSSFSAGASFDDRLLLVNVLYAYIPALCVFIPATLARLLAGTLAARTRP